ncbi:hypothetical protein ACV229_13350 [Burkholderia sp. MR1-5-21]
MDVNGEPLEAGDGARIGGGNRSRSRAAGMRRC